MNPFTTQLLAPDDLTVRQEWFELTKIAAVLVVGLVTAPLWAPPVIAWQRIKHRNKR